jgi:signal transduction histidine kinase
MSLATATCCPSGSGYMTGTFLDWFAGDGSYSTLYHCMGGDTFWIVATVALDLAVAAGYLLIARHWWVNERTLPHIPARRALGNMRNIFLFCGICGYIFIPIKMFWPAWRLYDLFMLFLVYFTWRYAWGAKDLKVIYAELGRSNRLERELEKSKEESRRKSFFLNAISHDLRTPLNGLMLQASVADLSLQSGDKEGLRQSLEDMKGSARATAEMLDSLLEFARLDWSADSNTLSTFGLCEAVNEVVQQLHTSAEQKRLELRVNCPAGLKVTTDRVKLERVLANLVSNAIKFTERGSVRIEVEAAASGVEIHVLDTGVGISAESRERLFEEFFQVHNNERDRRKGFGLGLAIARRLARQLGGDLIVDSALGKGSRFTLALPNAVASSSGSNRDDGPGRNGEPALAGAQPIATA